MHNSSEMSLRLARGALFLVGRLHLLGFELLRVMPTWVDGRWTLYVSPASHTLRTDGAFIPDQHRSDALVLRSSGIEASFDELQGSDPDPVKLFSRVFRHAQESRFGELAFGPDDAGMILQLCKGEDQEYRRWFLELCGRLALDCRALPARVNGIDSSIGRAPLYIHFRSPDNHFDLLRLETWPSPPSSKAFLDVQIGQSIASARDIDAPNLIWPTNKGNNIDSRIDEWWDQFGRP
jgi:hypothetical protein